MSNYNPTEKQLLIAFGLRLRTFRLLKQLSQEQLAENSELHRTYISSAERGERNISLLNLNKLAEALEITVAMLIMDE
jgi:transcriptional regulator with XRE-family HTH domain